MSLPEEDPIHGADLIHLVSLKPKRCGVSSWGCAKLAQHTTPIAKTHRTATLFASEPTENLKMFINIHHRNMDGNVAVGCVFCWWMIKVSHVDVFEGTIFLRQVGTFCHLLSWSPAALPGAGTQNPSPDVT